MKTITISELASRLSVHPDTIRKWESLGHAASIKTLGGHRRYLECEADHLAHQMKCPAFTRNSFSTLEGKTWFGKDSYLNWKRFVGFHQHDPKNTSDPKEVFKRLGSEKVIEILDTLSDDDWRSIDKIDEALEPIYLWYKTYHEYYWESAFYNMDDVLRKGTHRAIRDGKDVTGEVMVEDEKRFNAVLQKLNMKRPTQDELSIIGYQLDGIKYVLFGLGLHGGVGDGNEKSLLEGRGIFPHEREQMELDRKNGWDGISDFTEQRNKLMQENMLKSMQKYHKEQVVNPAWLQDGTASKQ